MRGRQLVGGLLKPPQPFEHWVPGRGPRLAVDLRRAARWGERQEALLTRAREVLATRPVLVKTYLNDLGWLGITPSQCCQVVDLDYLINRGPEEEYQPLKLDALHSEWCPGVPFREDERHGAAEDAMATLRIFKEFIRIKMSN